MAKILNELEIEELFHECLRYDFFIETLNDYEKEAVFSFANEFWSLPKEDRLYILNNPDINPDEIARMHAKRKVYAYEVGKLIDKLKPKFGWQAHMERMGGDEYSNLLDDWEKKFGLELFTQMAEKTNQQIRADRKFEDFLIKPSDKVIGKIQADFKGKRATPTIVLIQAMINENMIINTILNNHQNLTNLLTEFFKMDSKRSAVTQAIQKLDDRHIKLKIENTTEYLKGLNLTN